MHPRSVFVVQMPVRRKPGYYLANVVPTYFAIVCFGWFGFGNDTSDSANRLNYLAALLLAVIALKFTWKEKLPRVHYLTYLDWYAAEPETFLRRHDLKHPGTST